MKRYNLLSGFLVRFYPFESSNSNREILRFTLSQDNNTDQPPVYLPIHLHNVVPPLRLIVPCFTLLFNKIRVRMFYDLAEVFFYLL